MLHIVYTVKRTSLQLDHLKEGNRLRGYGQRDPLIEYKKGKLRAVPGDKDRVDEGSSATCGGCVPWLNDEARRCRAAAAPAPRAAESSTTPRPIEVEPEHAPRTQTAEQAIPFRAGATTAPPRVGGDDAAVRPFPREPSRPALTPARAARKNTKNVTGQPRKPIEPPSLLSSNPPRHRP